MQWMMASTIPWCRGLLVWVLGKMHRRVDTTKNQNKKLKNKKKKTGWSYGAAGRTGSAGLAHSSARGGGVPCVAALHFGGHAAQGLPKGVQAQVWGRHCVDEKNKLKK